MQEKEIQQTEIQPIPDYVLSWLEVKGFIDLYIEKSQSTTTLRAAYELAEVDFIKAYKRRRYANYDNFIKSKWHYANRILRENKNLKKTK